MAKRTKKQRQAAARKGARTRAKRNPGGIPMWLWLVGGAALVWWVTRPKAVAALPPGTKVVVNPDANLPPVPDEYPEADLYSDREANVEGYGRYVVVADRHGGMSVPRHEGW